MEKTSDGRTKGTAETGSRGGDTVDRAQHLGRRGGIGQKDGGGWESDDMECDLADQGHIDSERLELGRKKDEVGYSQVERGPYKQNKAEGAQSTKVLDDKWEQPQLGDHGVHALHGKHKPDGLRGHSQAAGKLEG